MNYQLKILDLQGKLIEGNYMLLQLLNGLNAEDKKVFAPKVEKHIAESKVLFETKIGDTQEAPTLLLHEQTDNRDDIPEGLYRSPGMGDN